MKNSINKIEKNENVSQQVRSYFEDIGINIDLLCSDSEIDNNKFIILLGVISELRNQIQDIKKHISIIEKELE